MKFSLKQLFIWITIVCLIFGSYSVGKYQGNEDKRKSYLYGYAEAKDHYQAMLSNYAQEKQIWEKIGEMWRSEPNMHIIGDALEDEKFWKLYVQHAARTHGWKDSSIFNKLIRKF